MYYKIHHILLDVPAPKMWISRTFLINRCIQQKLITMRPKYRKVGLMHSYSAWGSHRCGSFVWWQLTSYEVSFQMQPEIQTGRSLSTVRNHELPRFVLLPKQDIDLDYLRIVSSFVCRDRIDDLSISYPTRIVLFFWRIEPFFVLWVRHTGWSVPLTFSITSINSGNVMSLRAGRRLEMITTLKT